MIRALPHLLVRLRRALHLHFLRGRLHQLQHGIQTLEDCMAHDRLLVDSMRREVALLQHRLQGQAAVPRHQPGVQP